MKAKNLKYSLILTLAVILLLGLSACSEKDVPYIIDADELIKYVNNEPYARELFRTSGFISTVNYRVPFSAGLMRDSLLSVSRSLEAYLVPLDESESRIYVVHPNPIGAVREGLVRVHDTFRIQVTQTYSDTVLYDTTQMSLERFGFFLKLGTDDRPYVGWVLYGYNGIGSVAPPLGVELVASSGAQFRGDLGLYLDQPLSLSTYIPRISYIKLSEIDTVLQGSRLLITTHKASSTAPTTQFVSDYDPVGAFTRPMYRYDAVEYIDSLSYQTVASNPRLYNLAMIQYFSENTFPARAAFVVPYRW